MDVEKWVEEQAEVLKPKKIIWLDGSDREAHELVESALKENFFDGRKTLYELSGKKFPNSFLHRSHPDDVARTEKRTFMIFEREEEAGPTNNWIPPDKAKEILKPILKGAMEGRTMYVIPFVMGHPDSPYAQPCVQITDSTYVAISMRIMARVGEDALKLIRKRGKFIKGVHTIGELDKEKKYIMHFPEEELVVSVNSGYGGNALLGKKCIALRLASWKGKKEGWLAEHMLLIEVESPEGKKYYFLGAFPSASGKTNLALLSPTLKGWKVRTLGDDIAWLWIGDDGRLWAMNPEAGFFGVAPGTSFKTNPNMMKTLMNDKFFPTLFTNVALDVDENTPWWEGLEDDWPIPEHLVDWQGNPWSPESGKPAAHPNSRFTVSIRNCPILSPEYDNPRGVPVSGIIFGGRRSDTIPLVYETFDWEHGVFVAAGMGAETTAAAEGKVGVVRRDPFSMLPFCGYNMADYFAHWLEIGKKLKVKPKIFFVNWFRKDEDGSFLWPGFGENIRAIKWMIDRIEGRAEGKETPIGIVPKPEELDLSGLEISERSLEKLLAVIPEEWRREVQEIEKFFTKFGDRLPRELKIWLERLKRSFRTE